MWQIVVSDQPVGLVVKDEELDRFLVSSGAKRLGSLARAREIRESLEADGHAAAGLLPNEPATLPANGPMALITRL